ncbi:Ankyrin repeat protein 2 [Giardia muris]|uniref:Ankyrin repeat protein 2 n=1 Tax=Giardia muris TaxID=5742 RepID=A0A4Z1TDB6_GIAMU|nr:Ankyrin repeat protein 2 [Giardia muris]|eukprot:TNJ30529.1 Ankyrin repeat protein 2 [Giardia muris]
MASETIETTELIEAAKKGDVNKLSKHLGEARNYDTPGRTALMYAAEHGHCACVRMLVDLEGGMQNKYGLTALMFAIQKDRYKVIPFLIEKEAKLKDKSGWTGLMYAATRGYLSCAKALLCEATLQRDDGCTALMLAAEQGKEEMVSILKPYEQGLIDRHGRTAYWYATELNKRTHPKGITNEMRRNILRTLEDEEVEERCPHPSSTSICDLYNELSRSQAQNHGLKQKILELELRNAHLVNQLADHDVCNDKISFLQEQVDSLHDLINDLMEYNLKLKEDCEHVKAINLRDETTICVVCLTTPKSILFRPCNHCCVCDNCAQRIREECPLCRGLIQDTLKIFL